MLDSQPESPPLAMETDPEHEPVSPAQGSDSQEASSLELQPSTSTGETDGNSLPPLPNYSAAKTGRTDLNK